MRRLAFRRLLPAIQLFLFLTLVPLAEMQQREHDRASQSAGEAVARWDLMNYHDPYQPPALTVSYALNAPVFLMLEIADQPFDAYSSSQRRWFYYLYGSFCVFILWHFLGWVVDRRLNDHIESEVPPRLTQRILAWLSFVAFALLSLLALLLYMDGYGPVLPLKLWVGLWFGLAAVTQWRKLAFLRGPRGPTTLQLRAGR